MHLDEEMKKRLHFCRVGYVEPIEEFFGWARTIIEHHRLDSDSSIGKRMDWFR
jgi:hypothetical protein